jgi:aconitate hydratase
MGILPLQFKPGENAQTLGLTGRETFDVLGISDAIKPRQELTVIATDEQGKRLGFQVITRFDTPVDVDYYRNGGILQTVLRNLMSQ